MSGPLKGMKIVELAGIGPSPFAAMALSDAGADVIRIDRPIEPDGPMIVDGPSAPGRALNIMNRGRRSITLDLKSPRAIDALMNVIERADGVIEGFRPGVVERLGVGPEACAERNPRLVYGRVTGWGRSGPYAKTAGHDINYIALSGTLSSFGPADGRPTPPLNLLGDFGGGGLLLAFGMTCAFLETSRSKKGQVVDVAMVDGAAYLATYIHGMRAQQLWKDERESNVLDGGAPFYQVYKTKDEKFVAVGAIESKFLSQLLDLVGLEGFPLPAFGDRTHWEALHVALTAVFLSRTRDEWEHTFSGTDACVSPVLTMDEAPSNDHISEWGTFTEFDGVVQPSPTPRFSRTPSSLSRVAPRPGEGGSDALKEWGLSKDEIEEILGNGEANKIEGK